MFSVFKKTAKPQQGTTVTFTIDDMHCTSCAINIDGALEDLEGVLSASTNFAKATTKIVFDESKVTPKQLKKTIEEQGYSVVT